MYEQKKLKDKCGPRDDVSLMIRPSANDECWLTQLMFTMLDLKRDDSRSGVER